MTDFLAGVTFPDGEFTLVHDSVSGEAPPARAVASLATAILELSRSACGPQAFTATGFYRMQAGGMTAVVFAGEVGPPYQPGHAHADIFSFELFADAQRVFVDAGMHGYAGSALRPWCRSVVAHNTAQVGNREPVECWSVFRVAHRYRVRLLAWRETPRGRLLCAQHDGYGDTRHCRAILASAEGGLWVMDLLTGPDHESVTSRLHLHPALQFVRRSEGEFSVSGAGVQVCVWGAVIAEINPSWYCPRFGDALENQVLRLTAQPAPDVCLGYGIFADSDAISAAHRQEMFEWLVEQARKLSE